MSDAYLSPDTSIKSLFSIDGWLVHADTHRISRNGEVRKLEPRSMELLLYLADRPDQTVTRQEIEDNVWQGRVVGYDALSSSIAKIRRAFGDTSKNPRIIETISKGGYRIIATVTLVDQEAQLVDDRLSSETPAGSQLKSSLKPGFIRPPILVFTLIIVLFVLAAGIWLIYGNQQPGESELVPMGRPTLAILPFKNMSNDPGQDFFSDGLTDDLITDLSKISELKVTPRHSSYQFKDVQLPIYDLAERLNVRYIVQGSVRRSAETIRVSIQLIDARDNIQIWADRFDGQIDNVFRLQDKIADKIITSLKLKLNKADRASLSARKTTNLEAYDYYLRAEQRRLHGREARRGAETLDYYRKAIELDPRFVDAYAGLAREALYNWRLDASQIMPAATSRKLAYDSASKILELDTENPEAYAILGLLQATSGAHDVAIESVEQALDFDPKNPQLHADLATVLSYAGDQEMALVAINTAIDLHSSSPPEFYRQRAGINFFLGQYQRALEDFKMAERVSGGIEFYIWIYAGLNDLASARIYVDLTLGYNPFINQEYYRTIYSYYRRPQDLNRLVMLAGKAGVPRYAYSFDPGSRVQLDARNINSLVTRGAWRGISYNGNAFIQQFTAGNGVAQRTPVSMMSGTYDIEEDKLCVSFKAVLLDLPDCGYIYSTLNGEGYIWVTLGDIYQFKVSP